MDHRKPHFDYHNWDSVWFCFQSGDGNVMFGGRQESVWLFGWPRANRQPGDGVFQWADCFLSHSFHIKLNNWIFKFVRFLLTCAAGGQQAGRIKRGSIHLKGLVTFFSYTSVHLKKKKVWSSVSSVLPVVRCLQGCFPMWRGAEVTSGAGINVAFVNVHSAQPDWRTCTMWAPM